jgi:transforming growth factor-beta-induced protein
MTSTPTGAITEAPTTSPTDGTEITASLVESMAASSAWTKMAELMTNAGIVLDGDVSYTIFAPTNEAFADISFIISRINTEQLTQILKYHIVPGIFTSAELTEGMELTTLLGNTLTVTLDEASETILLEDTASLGTFDTVSSNGVLHSLSAVMIPVVTLAPAPAPVPVPAPTTSSSSGSGSYQFETR